MTTIRVGCGASACVVVCAVIGAHVRTGIWWSHKCEDNMRLWVRIAVLANVWIWTFIDIGLNIIMWECLPSKHNHTMPFLLAKHYSISIDMWDCLFVQGLMHTIRTFFNNSNFLSHSRRKLFDSRTNYFDFTFLASVGFTVWPWSCSTNLWLILQSILCYSIKMESSALREQTFDEPFSTCIWTT